MPDPKALADATRRIGESERALLSLGEDRSNPDNNLFRIRFVVGRLLARIAELEKKLAD